MYFTESISSLPTQVSVQELMIPFVSKVADQDLQLNWLISAFGSFQSTDFFKNVWMSSSKGAGGVIHSEASCPAIKDGVRVPPAARVFITALEDIEGKK